MPTATDYPVIGHVKANGYVTVTFPSGQTEEWTLRTVRARGYTPAAAPRQEFAVFNANGSIDRTKVSVLVADLRKGDVLFLGGATPTEIVTDPVTEGRDTTVRLAARRHRNGGWRRKLSSYNTVLVAAS